MGWDREDAADKSGSRSGLRVLVITANLGNALPDDESLAALLPRGGKAEKLLHAKVPAASLADGVSKADWNGVDPGGKVEIVAMGFQEASKNKHDVGNAIGLNALFTGASVSKGSNPLSKVRVRRLLPLPPGAPRGGRGGSLAASISAAPRACYHLDAGAHVAGGTRSFPDGMRKLVVWSTQRGRAAATTSSPRGWAVAVAACGKWGGRLRLGGE